MKAERERGDFRIRDAERVVRYLFFFFFAAQSGKNVVKLKAAVFFFCEPFVHKCKTLNNAIHKKGVRDVF